MTKVCYLCDRKYPLNENVSFHRFPKNPDLRQKWVNACGLNERDDVNRIYICSTHFISAAIRKIPTSSGVAKAYLDHGSVPTIDVPNPPPPVVEKTDQPPPVIESNMKLLFRTGVNTFQFSSKQFIIKDGVIKESSASESDNNLLTTSINNISTVPENIYDENMKIKPEYVEGLDTNDIVIQPSSENDNFIDSGPISNEDGSSPTKKRRFFDPRYISEITIDDVSTPKRARRVIDLMKKTDEAKTKKIKNFQVKIRRLRRRVAALEQKSPRLSKKKWSSEESVNSERPDYSEWDHTDHLYESQIPEVGNETEKNVMSNGETDPLCVDNNEDSEMLNFDTVSNTSENSQAHEIACDIFGNFVASEMKQIKNKNIYTKTKWKIQNAIMEGVEEQMQNESG